ncbi:S8 family peptidase [Lysobacter fragariae]
MNKHPVPAALAIATALVLAAPAGAAELKFARKPIQGQYIVVLKQDSAALAGESSGRRPALPAIAEQMSRAHGARLVRAFNKVLRGFVARADDRALARLLADPRVDYVEEDGIARATATQSGATWGIDRIDQRDLPLSGTYTYDTTASAVHAYIIDTGIRATHAEFGGRVGNGYTAINDGWGTSDCAGHGTHVSGTVGGATYGVAKGVRLHSVRVLGCDGTGSWSGIIAGIDWVAANHIKPAVANMSIGGGASSSVDAAVNRLVNAGVTAVVAAGNDNDDACNYSPARASLAFTIGSTTSSDARSSFSNYGSCVNLFAPGSNVRSAWNNGDTATNVISGTSMATPHVVGVAALYLANNPAATPSQVTTALLNGASANRISDVMGSPNRLLYSVVSGGGGGTDPCTGCSKYSGSLSGAGDNDMQPNGNYYQSTVSGTHQASTCTCTNGTVPAGCRWPSPMVPAATNRPPTAAPPATTTGKFCRTPAPAAMTSGSSGRDRNAPVTGTQKPAERRASGWMRPESDRRNADQVDRSASVRRGHAKYVLHAYPHGTTAASSGSARNELATSPVGVPHNVPACHSGYATNASQIAL